MTPGRANDPTDTGNAVGTTVLERFVWHIEAGSDVEERAFRDRVASLDNVPTGRRYALQDAHDNVAALRGPTGNVLTRFVYSPYGQRQALGSNDTPFAVGANPSDLRFGHQGLEHDAATGLINNRARTLNPILGRFMQRDPLGYVDGPSTYQAYHASPLIHTDPSGMVGLEDGIILQQQHERERGGNRGGNATACCGGTSFNPRTHCCEADSAGQRGVLQSHRFGNARVRFSESVLGRLFGRIGT
ncbi:MAG: RHS repeat-associated core domain-containing protein [Candidatus Competibacteraceae bacterium]|nr:RHS repeat-associated core domain-containing protein [Candidatus Competibacteraceae bacterium]